MLDDTNCRVTLGFNAAGSAVSSSTAIAAAGGSAIVGMPEGYGVQVVPRLEPHHIDHEGPPVLEWSVGVTVLAVSAGRVVRRYYPRQRWHHRPDPP